MTEGQKPIPRPAEIIKDSGLVFVVNSILKLRHRSHATKSYVRGQNFSGKTRQKRREKEIADGDKQHGMLMHILGHCAQVELT